MRIGILGGTGNMGRGLAVRLALKHEVLIGSRSIVKAQKIAKELNNLSKGFYQAEMQGNITGLVNSETARDSEIVVVTLPPEATKSVLRELSEILERKQIVISTGARDVCWQALIGHLISGPTPIDHALFSRRRWPGLKLKA